MAITVEDVIKGIKNSPHSFWLKVKKNKEGCWNWVGTVDKRTDNPIFKCKGRPYIAATRIAWALEYGYVGPKMFIHRSCDNSLCVRQDHLLISKKKRKTVKNNTRHFNKYQERTSNGAV